MSHILGVKMRTNEHRIKIRKKKYQVQSDIMFFISNLPTYFGQYGVLNYPVVLDQESLDHRNMSRINLTFLWAVCRIGAILPISKNPVNKVNKIWTSIHLAGHRHLLQDEMKHAMNSIDYADQLFVDREKVAQDGLIRC